MKNKSSRPAQMQALRKTDVTCRVSEYHEQGHPEIIEVKHKGKWFRYVHFSSELELRMKNFIKKNLS